jgi:glycosyltransferase involved in cell wall biosynthesis
MNIYYNWERLKKWCVRNFNAAGRINWKFRFQNFWYLHFGFLYPHNKKLRYKYVIVSPTYNVAPYIEDFYRSIVWQSGNFRKSVHIVTVNDGSIDGTAKIAQKWQKRYPQNITYLYKRNDGHVTARNHGMRYVFQNIEADFITFVDPDDFVDWRYFAYVDQALTRFALGKEKDVGYITCQPLIFDERLKKYMAHPLNAKFGVDSEKVSYLSLKNVQEFVNSAFFSWDRVLSMKFFFDSAVKPSFEDAVFIFRLLMDSCVDLLLVLVPRSIYFYRKRKSGDSLVDNCLKSINYFLTKPKAILRLLEERDTRKQRYRCSFLDRVIIYELGWLFRDGQSVAKKKLHPQPVYDECFKILRKIFSYIDPDIVETCQVGCLWSLDKIRMLSLLYSKDPKTIKTVVYIERIDFVKKEIHIYTYTRKIHLYTFVVDGSIVVPLYMKCLALDSWNMHWGYRLCFILSYTSLASQVQILKEKEKCYIFDVALQKFVYLFSISDALTSRHKRSLSRNDRWLIMDRDIQADDNGEHFYRYVKRAHPEKKVYFCLDRHSPCWSRLRKEGFSLVDFRSSRWRRLFWKSGKLISSHAAAYISQPFGPNSFQGKDFVFLQHGVINYGMASAFNDKKIDLFITSLKAEWLSIVSIDSSYIFSPAQVKLTGLPRHDNLLKLAKKHTKDNKKSIVVTPTWREYAVGDRINTATTISRNMNPHFYETEYAQMWGSFLKSQELLVLSRKYGYQVVFFPHAEIMPYVGRWEIPKYITVETCQKKSIQRVFVENRLMITDFSSVAFEMAYLRKPVIYFQFDEQLFYKHHAQNGRGHFDYRHDGFGPVVTTEEELLMELGKLLRRNCQPGLQYLKRMEGTFPFRDEKCCERVYQAICDLDKPRHPDDFDREVLIRYAENAELQMKMNFAQESWLKLFTYGSGSQKKFARLHEYFCRSLSLFSLSLKS